MSKQDLSHRVYASFNETVDAQNAKEHMHYDRIKKKKRTSKEILKTGARLMIRV
jgi:hypothetical protein